MTLHQVGLLNAALWQNTAEVSFAFHMQFIHHDALQAAPLKHVIDQAGSLLKARHMGATH